ncbi:MAG: tripartite tricarboxylate transporter substrate binding protein [Hyphomicrobiales bacterium]|nr:MAG: tripartite tricarboxylate transporter substrate binding protein [Hyphomicrobiales bacterium]
MPMVTTTRRALLAGAGALALDLGSSGARAAGFPDQTVKIVVPFSAGSMTDIVVRSLAEKLQAAWGQNVVVENRSGVPGTSSVARAAPDGLTLLFTSNGHVVLGAINKNLPFDPIADFVPVAKVATTPGILITAGDGPYRTLAALIDAAKAKPGALTYASAGVGSATGIAAELFKKITETNLVMVAHRGLPEANTSVLRGDTAMGFTFFNVGGDLIRAGQLRALAVTGNARMSQLPDVPTFAEAGLSEFVYDAWFAMFAPAHTPPEIVAQLARDVTREAAAPDLAHRFAPQGALLTPQPGPAFAGTVREEADRYRKLVQDASNG